MTPLSCRSCGAPLGAGDMDRRLAIISCSACGAIFDLTRGQHRGEADPDAPPPDRAPVPLPQGVELQPIGGGVRLRRRWFEAHLLMLIPFAIAWDAFLVNWYWTALSGPGPVSVISVVFPVAHVAAGVGVTWMAIANLVNHSVVEVTAGTLRVRHGPLPWWPAPTLRARDIEQLYVTREVSRSKNGPSISYTLRAVTRDHLALKLLSGLSGVDQALWLEQTLEEHLDLRDRPVAGEVRGETQV